MEHTDVHITVVVSDLFRMEHYFTGYNCNSESQEERISRQCIVNITLNIKVFYEPLNCCFCTSFLAK
jgi:hypothetical protein